MKLKTATLIAIVGQSTALIINLFFNFLQLYQTILQTFGGPSARVIFAIPGVIGVGSVLVFFATLYAKQD